MILLGRPIGAEQALAWGLVNRVAAAGVDVVDDAVEWMSPIVQGAPIAMAAALEALDRALSVSLEAGLLLEKLSYERTLYTQDRLEALAARAERRKPQYTGK
jgi:enoyl-CoA hydratase/carnithine racemase